MTLAVPGYIHRPHTESANCIEKVRPSHRIGPHTLTIVDVARHVPAAHSSDRGRARASELDTVSGVRVRWQVFAGIANLSSETKRDEKLPRGETRPIDRPLAAAVCLRENGCVTI